MHEIEVESKFEISEPEAHRLLRNCSIKHQSRQLNVYFDSLSCLKDHSGTFRLRYSDADVPRVTLKIPISIEDETRSSEELEDTLQRVLGHHLNPPRRFRTADLPPTWRIRLDALNISYLVRVGSMRNKRWVLSLNNRSFELDEVVLPDGNRFWEVEIEHPSAAYRRSTQYEILRFAPSARPSKDSKFGRFCFALNRAATPSQ